VLQVQLACLTDSIVYVYVCSSNEVTYRFNLLKLCKLQIKVPVISYIGRNRLQHTSPLGPVSGPTDEHATSTSH